MTDVRKLVTQRVPEGVDAVVPDGHGNGRIVANPKRSAVDLCTWQRLNDDEPDAEVGKNGGNLSCLRRESRQRTKSAKTDIPLARIIVGYHLLRCERAGME